MLFDSNQHIDEAAEDVGPNSLPLKRSGGGEKPGALGSRNRKMI